MNLDSNSNNKFLSVIISIFIIFALLAVVSLFSHEAAGKLTVIPQSASPVGKAIL